MFVLNSSIGIYIPSTTNIDRPISQDDHNARALETAKFLGDLFGGATIYDKCLGYWQGITEQVKIVVSFTDSQDLDKHYDRVIDHVATLCQQWQQDSIAIEFDHHGDHYLALIDQQDEKITIK